MQMTFRCISCCQQKSSIFTALRHSRGEATEEWLAARVCHGNAMSSSWTSFVSRSSSLLQGFAQLVYPNHCWVCGVLKTDQENPACASCLPHLIHDPFPTCPRCSSTVGPHVILDGGCPFCRNESYAFDGALRMARYDGLLRDVILRMKCWTGEELTQVIGALWARQMVPRLRPLHPDVVIPVPLHWTRQWRRGFNQSAILASCLARELSVPCAIHVLRRLRRTDEQKRLPTGAARRENVRHAFHAHAGGDLRGKAILLVDDVLTSGATASESARALRIHRPSSIHAVVMAHGK